MNKIQIKIRAPSGGGKTTISYLIAEIFKKYGFTVDVFDYDDIDIDAYGISDDMINERLQALSQHYSIEIETIQARRQLGAITNESSNDD